MKEKFLKIKENFLNKQKIFFWNIWKNIKNITNKIIISHNNLKSNLKSNLKDGILKKDITLGGNILEEKLFLEKEELDVQDEKKEILEERGRILKEEVELEKKEEIIDRKIKNNFSDIFKNEDIDWDIFGELLKKKKVISISDNSENALDSKNTKHEVKDLKKLFNLEYVRPIFVILSKYAFVLLLFLISLFISFILFFNIIFDSNNYIFNFLWWETLWSKNDILSADIKKRRASQLKIESSVKKMDWDVPSQIYIKTPYFDLLEKELKNSIFKFYSAETWKIKKISKVEKNELVILFNANPELSSLKSIFLKQDVLNSIINNRIYWKSVYKDLVDVTNNVFKYNDIINYVTYDNFSVNSDWEISVSWVVTDPSWKVFSQLFRLEKAINNSNHFNWVSIDNFNKTLNPDKNMWWMVTSINLRFNYIK